MKNKTEYLAANLIAPGVGQLMAKKWLLGALMFITGQVCAAWIIWEIVHLWYVIMQNVLNGRDINFNIFSLKRLFLAFSALAITWLISYADLYLTKAQGK